jgi:DNA-binding response OmpR family regulator
MRQRSSDCHILLIGRWDSYLERFAQILEALNFSVHWLDIDEYPSFAAYGYRQMEIPDLVVLSCLRIGPEENQLIVSLLADHHHLLVVSTLLPVQMMRSLFLLGVDDATDRPYSPQRLVAILQQTLDRIAFQSRSSPATLNKGSAL